MKNKVFKQKFSMILILTILMTLFTFNTAFATEHKTEVPEYYIPIYTAEDLDNIRNDLSGKYILMSDIDLSGLNWEPIGGNFAFKGVLDGNNYVIKNLTINSPEENYLGLFGAVNNLNNIETPNILNLGLVDVNIVGMDHIGGIAGTINDSIVENCYATGVINYKEIEDCIQSNFGGLFGRSKNSEIYNSYSNVKVDGDVEVGGFVGCIVGGSIVNCYSDGEVNGNSEVGGFAGVNKGSITNCYSTGEVSYTSSYGGGFIGNNGEKGGVGDLIGSVKDSYYNSDTSGMSDTGKGTPLTTQEMKQQSSFGNWDFETVWNIVEGTSYPTLQWEDTSTDSEEPITGSKIILKKGTNTVKLDKEEIKISTVKAGEKDVGTYLTLYKKVLEDVDATENNKVLTKINNFLTNLFSK